MRFTTITWVITIMLMSSAANANPIVDYSGFGLGPSTGGFSPDSFTSATNYDADTFVFTMSHVPISDQSSANLVFDDFPGPGPWLEVFSWVLTLTAIVDNSGNFFGGTFALFGEIPSLSITDVSLLFSGIVLDTSYGFLPNEQIGFISLLEMTNFADPLREFEIGPLAVYYNNLEDAGPGTIVNLPWDTSFDNPMGFALQDDNFNIYPARRVPEPSTLTLFCIGLIGFRFARKQFASKIVVGSGHE